MDKDLEIIEKKALKAIKIAMLAVFISVMLGILSLWVLLNQVTVSAGIDKKLISIEKRLEKIENVESGESTESTKFTESAESAESGKGNN
ncbi:hypothetical protein CCY99_03060 [Helicobacter sp. 16-1353]|uniref:DUF5408 family protein n=1 Tax=Helicobacter sp. 16-1353 TaxID=2004996 RepID=UPI000DCC7D6C|nr:DUF5408 family protein [Helicobacter sp. 16-1353]RAX54754.1 hypothetical protein CCY99_03060 [Helicobacter sp. 16-1353]